MGEEIFGPVVTVYVYKDAEAKETMQSIIKHSPYSLTGALYCQDQEWANMAAQELRPTAGNFYVNDKSIRSVVGQQPFGVLDFLGLMTRRVGLTICSNGQVL